MTERLSINTSDGVTLEARIDSPEQPERLAVVCHPHTLQGGSMNAPLMIAVTLQLVERGHTVLRFNFRGTGESTGEHDFGNGELTDITAAMDVAKTKDLPIGLAGWSFGASMALQWLGTTSSAIPYVGIAPPPQTLPENLPAGPKRVIVGNRDQVIDLAALQSYVVENGIDLVITPGDHFFHGRGKRIGDLVGEGLEA